MGNDLMRRLLATIEEWGRTQEGGGAGELGAVTLEALLKTITAICVFRELSSLGTAPQEVQARLRRVFREAPIEEAEPEMLLRLRARKDVLLRNLESAVRGF